MSRDGDGGQGDPPSVHVLLLLLFVELLLLFLGEGIDMDLERRFLSFQIHPVLFLELLHPIGLQKGKTIYGLREEFNACRDRLPYHGSLKVLCPQLRAAEI